MVTNYKRQRKKRNSKSLNKLRLQRLDNLSEQKMYSRQVNITYFDYVILAGLGLLPLLGIYFLIF